MGREAEMTKWREDYAERTQRDERWRLYKTKFPELIEMIKGEVSEDLV